MRKLDNYLRSSRRRAGLSQEEMAYLVGAYDGTRVSRYERFTEVPRLETALAYEAILGTPARELFAGMYDNARRAAIRRARVLKRRLAKDGKFAGRKVKVLSALAPDDNQAT